MATKVIKDDPTKGINPLLPDLPEVIGANGKTYVMARLGLKQLKPFVALLKALLAKGALSWQQLFSAVKIGKQEQFGAILALGLIESLDDYARLVAALLEINEKDIYDNNIFTLEVLGSVGYKLFLHPDVEAFFTMVRNAMADKRVATMFEKMFSSKDSTDSEAATT